MFEQLANAIFLAFGWPEQEKPSMEVNTRPNLLRREEGIPVDFFFSQAEVWMPFGGEKNPLVRFTLKAAKPKDGPAWMILSVRVPHSETHQFPFEEARKWGLKELLSVLPDKIFASAMVDLDRRRVE